MIAFLPVRRFLNVLIPHRYLSVIPNVVADLSLLLLVLVYRPHLLRLSPGPAQPYFPAPPCSASPLSPLPVPSESLAVAVPSLNFISMGVNSSPSHLPASQALVIEGQAAGDASVSASPVIPTSPCSQGASSVSLSFWERPAPAAPSPLSSAILLDLFYSSGSLSSDLSPLRSLPSGGLTPYLHPPVELPWCLL